MADSERSPKDKEARRAFLKSYSVPTPYFDMLRDHYLEKIDIIEETIAWELECTEACVNQSDIINISSIARKIGS